MFDLNYTAQWSVQLHLKKCELLQIIHASMAAALCCCTIGGGGQVQVGVGGGAVGVELLTGPLVLLSRSHAEKKG